jgi:capsular polysaccharide biosynthesis protein
MQTYATRNSPAHRAAAYESASLRWTVRGILRSWWIVLLAAAVAVGGAIAYSKSRPTTFQATTSLLFNDDAYQQSVAGGYNPVDAERRLKTSANMLGLPTVAEKARQSLRGNPAFHPAGASVKTEYSADANTMKIVATGRDRRTPGLLANATANAFLSYRSAMGSQSLQEARQVLKEQIAHANTKGERRLLVAKRNNLDAVKALNDQSIQVSQQAGAVSPVASRNTLRNALIAGVLGALVGIGISLLRVRDPEPIPALHDPWVDDETPAHHS